MSVDMCVIVAFDKGKKEGDGERGVVVFCLLGAPNLPPPPPPPPRPLVVRFQSGLACVALLLCCCGDVQSKPVRPSELPEREKKAEMWCYVAPCPKYPYPQKDPAEEVARGRVIKEEKNIKIGHTIRFGWVWKMDNSRKFAARNDVFLFLVKARRALDGEGVIVRSCYNSFPDRPKKKPPSFAWCCFS